MTYNLSLETLELVGVGIGNQTLPRLATSLTYNTTLKILNLDENATVEGYRPFVETIQSFSNLKKFEFYHTRLIANIISIG